jgi:hypothetical protein
MLAARCSSFQSLPARITVQAGGITPRGLIPALPRFQFKSGSEDAACASTARGRQGAYLADFSDLIASDRILIWILLLRIWLLVPSGRSQSHFVRSRG